MNARYYDPVVGRFMAIDPVGPLDGGVQHLNRYSYAYNNPYRYTDPTGLLGESMVDRQIDDSQFGSGGGSGGLPSIGAGGAGAGFAVAAAIASGLNSIRNSLSGLFAESSEASVSEGQSGGKSPADQVQEEIDRLTEGLPNEKKKGKNGKPVPGNYVDEDGDVRTAQEALDSLTGTPRDDGRKDLPDGSNAGIHTSTTTGKPTLSINRPAGYKDVKIRYGKD